MPASLPACDIGAVAKIVGVRNVEYDEPLLSFQLEGDAYSIMVPDRYPRARAEYYGPTSSGTLHEGPLVDMINELIDCLKGGHSQSRQLSEGAESISTRLDSEGMEQRTTSELMQDTSDDALVRQQSTFASAELEHDVEALRARKDVHSFSVRFVSGHAYIKWNMSIGDLVPSTVASAWGMDSTKPMEVVFKCWSHYLDAPQSPTMEFYQDGKKFPFGQQMARIVTTHLSTFWPRKFPTTVVTVNHDQPNENLRKTQREADDEEDVALTPKQFDAFLKLCSTGYSAEEARRLALSGNRRSGPGAEAKEAPAPTVHGVDAAVKPFLNPESTRYDPRTDPNKACAFVPHRGVLSHCIDLIRLRTPTISKYCVLCDQPHLFANNMIRPAVCSRDMCVYQFQELKLGSDAAESVATDAGVVDLLLTIFRAAAVSKRAVEILKPFPSVAHPRNPKQLALDPTKPDHTLVMKVLENFPTTRDVVRCEDLIALKERLERTEPLAYPLLEWVIASNRSHLIQLDQRALIGSMDTPYQYLLLTAAPEKERIFQDRKRKYGTKFAFHGSRAENWHSILRNGLRNYSGTVNQLNGAAHGKGVYFASTASHSFGYSGAAGKNATAVAPKAEFLSDSMVCVALCEIVDNGIKEHGWCWTVEDEANIVTRYFFAYTTNPSQRAMEATAAVGSAFLSEVQSSMSFYALA